MLAQFFLIFTLSTNPAGTCFAPFRDDPEIISKYCLVNALFCAHENNWQKSSNFLLRLQGLRGVKVETVLPFLSVGNDDFRSNIVEILGDTGDKKAVKPLIKLLEKESNPDVKISIIEAFGKLKDKRAVRILEKQLADELWGVRMAAASSLENITGKQYAYTAQGQVLPKVR